MSSRILVAEDEEIMRITVVDHLRSLGWQVDAAATGLKALELIKQHRYQLLLSDIRMPGMDGAALLAAVKTLAPRTEVVMMTAHGSTETAVDCLKNGAADYLQKPFDLDDLSFSYPAHSRHAGDQGALRVVGALRRAAAADHRQQCADAAGPEPDQSGRRQ